MILNVSRAKAFQECRVRNYNWDELRLVGFREADALLKGGAFHTGAALWFAKKNLNEAANAAEQHYRKGMEGVMLLPEEVPIIEQNIEFCRRMIEKYAEHYRNDDIQVLMPEVKFCIPLEDTTHHCWYFHRLLHPDDPHKNDYDEYAQLVPKAYTKGSSNRCEDPRCWSPHFFTGRTDAVISWGNLIWLLEHKTATNTGQIYYRGYELDKQTTGYIWGIWKQTGLRPHGFLLNVIKKPNANVAKSNPFQITFEREPFIRSDATLEAWVKDFKRLARDYEYAHRTGNLYKNEDSCTNWNRVCQYHEMCKSERKAEPGEFKIRLNDYVNDYYYTLLDLPIPTPPVTSEPTLQLDERYERFV